MADPLEIQKMKFLAVALLLAFPVLCLAQTPVKLPAASKKKLEELSKKLSTWEQECIDDILAGNGESRVLPRFTSPNAFNPGQVGTLHAIFRVAEIIDKETMVVHLGHENGLSFVMRGFPTKPFVVGSKYYGAVTHLGKPLVMVRKSDELKDKRLPDATMVIEPVANPAFVEALGLFAPKKRR